MVFSSSIHSTRKLSARPDSKVPPDADGVVEIAYGVAPEYQGRGYATEAATALVEFALSDPRVQTVRAHTLPEPNASTRVLTRNGFRHLGEVMDPEDGRVWRWELRRS
jgi:RimJ/RimL family protein N-acetyltransferase